MKNILLPLFAALYLSCNLDKIDDPSDELSAEITVQASKIFVGCPVTFNNTSTDVSSYAWNFGDGNTATIQNPEHVFYTPEILTTALMLSLHLEMANLR